ncbi:RNA methyltransferase [Iodobacter sp. CM08]|uniref:TrmH family RNA methyltransferase n=1 Tax=Iodobacter sp. CM08 TaxID=3085902 RepID=UPI002981115F|nr:RNA methyltransferase [Iodobacter sp. CM08]MDW5417113.1 RNA methyltransferase [Iodobacter sp. CM08]
MLLISSRQNPFFKTLLKLATSRKERRKTGQTLLDGTHLLLALADVGGLLEKIILTPAALENSEVQSLLLRFTVPQIVLDEALFTELSDLPSTTGIMGLYAIPAAKAVRKDGFCLLLDGVQDPGNVGTILRTAAAFGVDQVLLADECADIWSPKVLRAGMGAHFVLDMLEHMALPAFAAGFNGAVAVTVLEQAVPPYTVDLAQNLALVLGSEGAGVSAAMQAAANLRLTIPMGGQIESLNVAAAAAILCYERQRQVSLSCA